MHTGFPFPISHTAMYCNSTHWVHNVTFAFFSFPKIEIGSIFSVCEMEKRKIGKWKKGNGKLVCAVTTCSIVLIHFGKRKRGNGDSVCFHLKCPSTFSKTSAKDSCCSDIIWPVWGSAFAPLRDALNFSSDSIVRLSKSEDRTRGPEAERRAVCHCAARPH